MKPPRKVLGMFLLALALLLAGANATVAAVWTGQADYEPGSLVTIYGDNSDGAGYFAGEPVFVEVWGPNGFHLSSEPNNPTVDANGAWSWPFTLWNSEDAVGEYRYIATGRTSNVSESGRFTDATAWWQIEASSIGPSMGVCGSPITVRATLQTKTAGVPWGPAEGKVLTFGLNNTNGVTLNSVTSKDPTDANGQATASIEVPKPADAVAVELWAQYDAPAQDPIYMSIPFNTPTLTFAVSNAIYDGSKHGEIVTLTNACGSWRPQTVYYGGQEGTTYWSDSAPIDAGSYYVEAYEYWGDDPISGFKPFTIAPAKASVTPNSFTRQYSDPNPPLTGALSGFLDRDGEMKVSYSTAATPASSPGEYSIKANPPANRPLNATPGLGNYIVTYNEGKVKVVEEDAHVSFDSTNPATLQASTPGGALNAGSLTLRVHVQELPEEPAAAGDINKAGIAVTLVPLDGGSPIGLDCSTAVAGLGYDTIKTFTCTNGAPIPVGAYDVSADVIGVYDASAKGIVAYYAGAGADVFTVDDAISGFATGGGWFSWPGAGDKTNFAFVAKPDKGSAKLKGSLLLIRHHPDGKISRLKSTALDNLKLQNVDGCRIATFSGKGTYRTWNATVGAYTSSGGHAFTVYAEDCGNPGSSGDSFWIGAVGDLVMPALASGNKAPLGGGNIAVPHGGKQ